MRVVQGMHGSKLRTAHGTRHVEADPRRLWHNASRAVGIALDDALG